MKNEFRITDAQIADGCNEAYVRIGHKGYFCNGFELGVEFALKLVNCALFPDVSNSGLDDYLDPNDRVHKISITTPYSINDILNFMNLTGLNIDNTEKVMANFSNFGISNIKDVNTLVKLGLFHYY